MPTDGENEYKLEDCTFSLIDPESGETIGEGIHGIAEIKTMSEDVKPYFDQIAMELSAEFECTIEISNEWNNFVDELMKKFRALDYMEDLLKLLYDSVTLCKSLHVKCPEMSSKLDKYSKKLSEFIDILNSGDYKAIFNSYYGLHPVMSFNDFQTLRSLIGLAEIMVKVDDLYAAVDPEVLYCEPEFDNKLKRYDKVTKAQFKQYQLRRTRDKNFPYRRCDRSR